MVDETDARQVRTLLDRQAVLDCLTRYARGVDRLDREQLLSAFHPDAVIDQGMFVGSPPRFADWAFSVHDQLHENHQHFLMNHQCSVDGDQARAETYFMFVGVNRSGAERTSSSGGRYLDHLERRQGVWRIVRRVVLRDWTSAGRSGAPDDPARHTAVAALLDDVGLALLATAPRPARDSSDPSYLPQLVIDDARVARGAF